MTRKYQTTPFRITMNPYGSFEAIASDGVIKPRTKKAKRSAEDAQARRDIENMATSYLRRKDWTWKT